MPGREKVRLMIVDDHAMVREALLAVFRNDEEFDVVAQAGDGEEAINVYEQIRPDVVLMDLRMPKSDGLEALHRIRARFRNALVLLYSGVALAQDVRLARGLGARGFISKNVDFSTLCRAILAVWNGEQFWDAELKSNEEALPALSPREAQVLEAARRGLSNADIGNVLFISEQTVKSHIKTLLKKLHAADRTEAVARGFELGMLR